MQRGTTLSCLVVGISDGDTLKARCGRVGHYRQLTIRLHGIDAPERRQPFGQHARRALATLCFKVQARITPRATDRYKRTVADVECRGEDSGRYLVRHGWAWVHDSYAGRDSDLHLLQVAARAERLGLWAGPKPVPPWDFRRNASSSH